MPERESQIDRSKRLSWWHLDYQPARFIYFHQRQVEYDPQGRPGAFAIGHSRWRAALRACRCMGCVGEHFRVG